MMEGEGLDLLSVFDASDNNVYAVVQYFRKLAFTQRQNALKGVFSWEPKDASWRQRARLLLAALV